MLEIGAGDRGRLEAPPNRLDLPTPIAPDPAADGRRDHALALAKVRSVVSGLGSHAFVGRATPARAEALKRGVAAGLLDDADAELLCRGGRIPDVVWAPLNTVLNSSPNWSRSSRGRCAAPAG